MRAPFRIITAIGALLAAVPAGAQTFDPRYPVCMRVYSGSAGGGGDWYECSFTSLPQCAASTSGRSASWIPITPMMRRQRMVATSGSTTRAARKQGPPSRSATAIDGGRGFIVSAR